MGAVEEFQAAKFDEGDVAPRQFDFQRTAMVRGAKQHRLLLELLAGFAGLQNLFDNVIGLVGLVTHCDETRPLGGLPFGPEVLGEALGRQRDHGIGRRKDRLGRTVIALQCDNFRRRRKLFREMEDVAHVGRAKGVNRLGVVADHRQAAAERLQSHQDGSLKPVGVLVLVNKDVIETLGHPPGQIGFRDHLRPIEQQIVVIERVCACLAST